MTSLRFIVAIVAALLTLAARAQVVVYSQPALASGGVHLSSWYAPDGLDSDQYVWDSFSLSSATAISEIRWRGGYAYGASGFNSAPVTAFRIDIYRSTPGLLQPDLLAGGRLARYTVNGNANETAVGTIGGIHFYDYKFTLPTAFQAAANTPYWVQIEASQGLAPGTNWPPDWGYANASGGNGFHFRKVNDGTQYQNITGDCAFTLLSTSGPTVNISATVSPAGSGLVTGAGSYPLNSTASLSATANSGWGFVNWTQNGTQVSASAQYTFSATSDRSLVANFAPTFSVNTFASPTEGGTTTGGGSYLEGHDCTVTATPNRGYLFDSWTDSNGGYSASPVYTFPVVADTWAYANFVPDPSTILFTFDDAPVHTSLPVAVSNGGLTATLYGGTYNFSIQPYGSVGLAPARMSGLYIFPNTVYQTDLTIDFSDIVTDFSILYSPQELGCDTSATMRATGYRNGVLVATNTATSPVPGTYPTRTLSLSHASGFDSVVVHYDARPPTCQDYGPIFLADNMLVTRGCRADFNADGFLDFTDFDTFVNAFESGESAADFNADGFLDFTDFDAFVMAFETGC